MDVDDIPGQLEELFDRSRAALDAQVTKARKAVDGLNAEKAAAAETLAELKDQITKARTELDSVRANLDRASNLRALNGELTKARAELEQLKDKTAKESTALEALTKQRTAAEARVVTLENDARQATAERCRAQEMMARIRQQVELPVGLKELKTMTNKDEIAALRARVEELERAAKPPEPFVPEPYQRYDPTANFSMPRSVMQEMVRAVPDGFMQDVVRDNQAPTGPSSQGAVPSSQQVSNVRGAGGVPGLGTGWSHSAPLAADDRDRKSLRERCSPFGQDDDVK